MCSYVRRNAAGAEFYGVQANGTMPIAIVYSSTMPMKELNACSVCANPVETGIPGGIAAGTNPVGLEVTSTRQSMQHGHHVVVVFDFVAHRRPSLPALEFVTQYR